MTWEQLLRKQEKEKAAFLQKYARREISRIRGARELSISLTYMTKLINKYNIDWPTRQAQREGTGISKVPGGVDTYMQMAKDGLSQAEASRKLGVSTQNVCNVARRNKIKFADGRTKGGPRSQRIHFD